jgi:hypothetical protein
VNKMVHVMVLLMFPIFTISACGGGGDSSAAATPGTLGVVNDSSFFVDKVQITPQSSTGWAYTYSVSLNPSDSMDLPPVPPDTYRFCARTLASSSYGFYACFRDISLVSGATYTITVLDTDFGGALAVNNNTGTQITEFYVKKHSQTTWSYNILTSPCAPGRYFSVGLDPGSWDARVVYSGSSYDYTSRTINALAVTILNVP